ncbi:MAG: hypothetical protein K8F91_15125, partial [Candidatus Obscuribacterales bacterium]|nr:hypothetical protein [Candidatus Obscuribacterales bacterium]
MDADSLVLQAEQKEDKAQSRLLRVGRPVAVLCALWAIELFCFYPGWRETGLYLDDWDYQWELLVGPQNFFASFQHLLKIDPRFVNRPIEGLTYVATFQAFGQNACAHHVFNAILEVASAFLLYLCFLLLTRRPLVSLCSAAVFLLYPSHNSTHYWVGTFCVTLSLLFYLGSLLCDIKGVWAANKWWHLGSAFLFTLMLLNYELFIPLGALNVLVVFFLAKRKEPVKNALLRALNVALLLCLSVGVLFFYLKAIVPLIGENYPHAVSFKPEVFFGTILEGLKLSFPYFAFQYFNEQIAANLRGGLTSFEYARLFGLGIVGALILFVGARFNQDRKGESLEESPRVNCQFLFFAGLMTVIAAYSIFGLNAEYFPTFRSLVNRINIGAAIGLSLILASGLLYLSEMVLKRTKKRALAEVSVILVSFSLIVYFALTNWALAVPYKLSWQLQSHIVRFLKSDAHRFQGAKSLLLINCPRYVGEAPVFDGIWDFG